MISTLPAMPKRFKEVIESECLKYEIGIKELLSHRQYYPLPNIRGKICARLRDMGLSMPRIGALLGLHHTTVLHHLRQEKPTTPPKPFDPDHPDLSGEWAI